MLAGPDLILSYVYTNGSILTDLLADTAHQLAGMNAGGQRRQRCLQFFAAARLQISDPRVCIGLGSQLQQLCQNTFDIANHRHVGGNVLADLGRIHIHMDGLGTTTYFHRIQNGTIGNSGTGKDQQITLSHGLVGTNVTEGTQHTNI